MRLGIKGKQVLGVTIIVGLVVIGLSAIYLIRIAGASLDDSASRADLLANAIYHRAREVVREGVDLHEALANDAGLRSILQATFYADNVTFAAIVDANGIAIAHADPALEGRPLRPGGDLSLLLSRPEWYQLFALYSDEGRNLELRRPLMMGDVQLGSIRIGVSTLLVRNALNTALRPALLNAVLALGISVLGAVILAQLLLRPIHVIRSGLTRLGRGEFGVKVDLEQDDEFGELGTFFNTVSQKLSADRTEMAGQVANLETAVELLEDAVAIVAPKGDLLFANPAFRSLVPNATPGTQLKALVPAEHPLLRMAQETLAMRQTQGPVGAPFNTRGETVERLMSSHPVNDANGGLVGVMLTLRNVEYLAQVESTVRYSRKLAALGRLSAGVAHEVKNPLNSMMIHLELLRQKFMARVQPVSAGRGAAADASADPSDVMQHVDVITGEIRRLDEVVQGFLKFTRPEDLKLQLVPLSILFSEVLPIVRPEAARNNVELALGCDGPLEVNGDPAMLRQAFLNLALNACQAMPSGGVLSIGCERIRGRRIAVTVTDTGVGIKPEHLKRIFDLYFTTKEGGSGIGLSMVYRTVQMHDGEIEVQSTPGKGTTFRVILPQA
ncbi:MAG: ATP-binding protein [Vicinamibacterales bacterium]